MCLIVDEALSERIKGGEATLNCYKVICPGSKGYTSPFFIFWWKQGENLSDYQTERKRVVGEVDNAIHVLFTIEDAKKYKVFIDVYSPYAFLNKKVIIPVKCHLKDFIAAGKDSSQGMQSAAFTKVEWDGTFVTD